MVVKKIATSGEVFTDNHPGHSEHMCELVGKRQMAKVAKLAAGAKYVCHICGRAASNAKNLCEPVEI
jgi:hypothetical protein